MYLYKNNETVRVGLDGFAAGVKSTFLNIFDAAKNILGGVGHLITGIFTLDKEEIRKGLAAMADGAGGLVKKVKADSEKAATNSRFQFGYERAAEANKKDKKSRNLLDELGNKSRAPQVSPLTKDLTATPVGGSVGGSKVTNITLRVDSPFRNTTINVNGVTEGAKQVADTFRDWFIAELNDVNTLSSAN